MQSPANATLILESEKPRGCECRAGTHWGPVGRPWAGTGKPLVSAARSRSLVSWVEKSASGPDTVIISHQPGQRRANGLALVVLHSFQLVLS